MGDQNQMYAYTLYKCIMNRIDELEDILNLDKKTIDYTTKKDRNYRPK